MQPSRSSIDLTGGATSSEPLESRVDDDLRRHRTKKTLSNLERYCRYYLSWMANRPSCQFGAPAHGKLMADQWRSCIEFDIPVSIVQQWAQTLIYLMTTVAKIGREYDT